MGQSLYTWEIEHCTLLSISFCLLMRNYSSSLLIVVDEESIGKNIYFVFTGKMHMKICHLMIEWGVRINSRTLTFSK